MWNIMILATMLSLVVYYETSDRKSLAAAEQSNASNLAGNMAVYRAAVAAYFTLNPALVDTSVQIASLQSAEHPLLPTWYEPLSPQPWANYIDGSGTIYIYASSLPSRNITADVVRLSKNSILAGVFRAGDMTLYSPVFGDTKIPLPASLTPAIPDGSPVWLAMRN